jgi:hypothetical protein
MKLWQMKCPNCKESGLSMLHGIAIAVIVLVVAFVLFKTLS